MNDPSSLHRLAEHEGAGLAPPQPTRRALVLGLGQSGLAMARWLAREEWHVRVADTRQDPPMRSALEWIARSGLDLVQSGPGAKGLGIPEP